MGFKEENKSISFLFSLKKGNLAGYSCKENLFSTMTPSGS